MYTSINLYSIEKGQIYKFLKAYYNKEINMKNELYWKKEYENPIEMIDIIENIVDNNDKFKINIWISLDKDCLINVNETNIDKIIRYLFERFPY